MNKRLSFDEVVRLVREHLGPDATNLFVNARDQYLDCVLLETFEFQCGVEEPHGSFTAAVLIGRRQAVVKFFGQPVTMTPDEVSIRASLDQIVEWCRLQLTDKFLEAYDTARRC